jgi:hypothetical protein
MRSRQDLQYQLIDAELTVGITYCRAAAGSRDPRKRASNLEQAERAYRTAVDFERRTKLKTPNKNALKYKTDYLRQTLDQIRAERVTFTLGRGPDAPAKNHKIA